MIFGKHINRYYLKYSPLLLLGLAALIAVDFFELKLPEFYRMVINGVNGQPVSDDASAVFNLDYLLDKICLPLVGVILILLAGRFLWRVCFFGTSLKAETDIRHRMFDHCKDLSQQYYQEHKVGNMMSLFTNDLETVQDCLGMGIMIFFDASFLGALAVVKMLRMDRTLTLFSTIPMFFLMAAAQLLGRYMTKKWERRQAAFSSLSDFSQESFSGIAVIKAFVKEAKELWAFRKLNRENEEANVDYTRLSVLLRITVTLFVESVICVILGYGGYLVHEGRFNAGELVEFIGYFGSVVWPVMAVSELVDMHSRGKASLNRISELLDAKRDVKDVGKMESFEPIRGDIEFRNLTFRYPGSGRDALRDASFTIKAGENVGIVGKTGCGKSTVADLILRSYNVGEGMLFVDGHDVNRLPIRAVRDACAYVSQENFLFSDTIENNIAFSKDGLTKGEIESAAALADVDGDIRGFAEGYGTVLGERGVTVSGGQKQRIAIARALVKDAPILILDDSVSSVDMKTEKIILDNLKSTRKGRTTILIAHRISAIENMEKVIFMEDGAVKAVGTQDELFESCEEYRRMVLLQRLEDEGGEDNNA